MIFKIAVDLGNTFRLLKAVKHNVTKNQSVKWKSNLNTLQRSDKHFKFAQKYCTYCSPEKYLILIHNEKLNCTHYTMCPFDKLSLMIESINQYHCHHRRYHRRRITSDLSNQRSVIVLSITCHNIWRNSNAKLVGITMYNCIGTQCKSHITTQYDNCMPITKVESVQLRTGIANCNQIQDYTTSEAKPRSKLDTKKYLVKLIEISIKNKVAKMDKCKWRGGNQYAENRVEHWRRRRHLTKQYELNQDEKQAYEPRHECVPPLGELGFIQNSFDMRVDKENGNNKSIEITDLDKVNRNVTVISGELYICLSFLLNEWNTTKPQVAANVDEDADREVSRYTSDLSEQQYAKSGSTNASSSTHSHRNGLITIHRRRPLEPVGCQLNCIQGEQKSSINSYIQWNEDHLPCNSKLNGPTDNNNSYFSHY